MGADAGNDDVVGAGVVELIGVAPAPLKPGRTRQRRELANVGVDPFVVVEKILSQGETLPADWPVDGTTGYDFLNDVAGLFVDGRNDMYSQQVLEDYSAIRAADPGSSPATRSRRTTPTEAAVARKVAFRLSSGLTYHDVTTTPFATPSRSAIA